MPHVNEPENGAVPSIRSAAYPVTPRQELYTSADEDELRRCRDTPTYRAGIWAFRVMLAAFAGYVVLRAGGHSGIADACAVAYCVAMLAGYVFTHRAGVGIFGYSPGIWQRRKLVYRDVFGLRWR